MPPTTSVLLRLADGSLRVIDTADVYLLEADGGDTLVRLRHREKLRDVVRIHSSWAVNPDRVREIRQQADGRDGEVVMDPPVNRVLPVARGTTGWAPRGLRGGGLRRMSEVA